MTQPCVYCSLIWTHFHAAPLLCRRHISSSPIDRFYSEEDPGEGTCVTQRPQRSNQCALICRCCTLASCGGFPERPNEFRLADGVQPSRCRGVTTELHRPTLDTCVTLHTAQRREHGWSEAAAEGFFRAQARTSLRSRSTRPRVKGAGRCVPSKLISQVPTLAGMVPSSPVASIPTPIAWHASLYTPSGFRSPSPQRKSDGPAKAISGGPTKSSSRNPRQGFCVSERLR